MSELHSEVVRVLNQIPIDAGGGCSVKKAYIIAELIRRNNLKTTVDIGIYRGRSLFPQAIAHKLFTGGMVYGVDPFTATDAWEGNLPPNLREPVAQWVKNTDFDALYQEILNRSTTLDMEKSLTVLRERSDTAIHYFKQNNILIDLIHIDGNHDTELVMRDLDLYVPIVSTNGYVILDDISWDSVKPVVCLLKRKMQLVFEMYDALNDFAVFWNSRSWIGTQLRRFMLLSIKHSNIN